MARAIVFSAYGDPSVLHEIDVDEPVAGPGQIRVHVKTAGVDPVDSKMRRGDFADVAPASFPQTLGNEFAGVVDQVGDDVTAFEIGSQVLGFTSAAAYAEFVVVGADQVTAKPARMPWEVAGALSAAGQTACNALQELRVGAGETPADPRCHRRSRDRGGAARPVGGRHCDRHREPGQSRLSALAGRDPCRLRRRPHPKGSGACTQRHRRRPRPRGRRGHHRLPYAGRRYRPHWHHRRRRSSADIPDPPASGHTLPHRP